MGPQPLSLSTTPARDWLMTAVGPPDWPITALPLMTSGKEESSDSGPENGVRHRTGWAACHKAAACGVRLLAMRCFCVLGLLVVFVVAPGCASVETGPGLVEVPAGRYPAAFDAARAELLRLGFTLERVDARAGVIETAPRSSAGLATPWIDRHASLGESWNGLLNRQRRRVTVRFEPRTDVPAEESATPPDIRTSDSDLVVSIDASVERLYAPGLQTPATSVTLSSRTVDPRLVQAAGSRVYAAEVSQDERLGTRVANAIRAAAAREPGLE